MPRKKLTVTFKGEEKETPKPASSLPFIQGQNISLSHSQSRQSDRNDSPSKFGTNVTLKNQKEKTEGFLPTINPKNPPPAPGLRPITTPPRSISKKGDEKKNKVREENNISSTSVEFTSLQVSPRGDQISPRVSLPSLFGTAHANNPYGSESGPSALIPHEYGYAHNEQFASPVGSDLIPTVRIK